MATIEGTIVDPKMVEELEEGIFYEAKRKAAGIPKIFGALRGETPEIIAEANRESMRQARNGYALASESKAHFKKRMELVSKSKEFSDNGYLEVQKGLLYTLPATVFIAGIAGNVTFGIYWLLKNFGAPLFITKFAAFLPFIAVGVVIVGGLILIYRKLDKGVNDIFESESTQDKLDEKGKITNVLVSNF